MTRLRLDAALYAPAPPRPPGTNGRPRKKGARLPTLKQLLADGATRWQRVTVADWYGDTARELELASATAVWYHAGLPVVPIRWVLIRDPDGRFAPQALLCTDLTEAPMQIVRWFVRRWRMEVTFEEARRHLGLETQRQWSDRAIARTTPVLLGLFPLVALLATQLLHQGQLSVRHDAWYHKERPTFADALAAVRAHWWRAIRFATSSTDADVIKLPRAVFARLTDALCYAA